MEIYNETIRDLLSPSDDDKKHEIKLVSAKKGSDVTVTNLTSIKVEHFDQVNRIILQSIVCLYLFIMNAYLQLHYVLRDKGARFVRESIAESCGCRDKMQ